MSGYFSVADRGTWGHWDISDEKGRVFTIRGDRATFFTLRDERIPNRYQWFSSPFEALEYAARQLMQEPQP